MITITNNVRVIDKVEINVVKRQSEFMNDKWKVALEEQLSNKLVDARRNTYIKLYRYNCFLIS